jgi:hypothetical protein
MNPWAAVADRVSPPGDVIAAGDKPGGGRVDFCWLIFERGYSGFPELRWLHREGVQ